MILRTRPAYGPIIRAAADVGGQTLDLKEFDIAVLAAIIYHQPITRDGRRDILDRDISHSCIAQLNAQDPISSGSRAQRTGEPYTFVTTAHFLAAFELASLGDLPDQEQWQDAGMDLARHQGLEN